jgi:hypothetical protein
MARSAHRVSVFPSRRTLPSFSSPGTSDFPPSNTRCPSKLLPVSVPIALRSLRSAAPSAVYRWRLVSRSAPQPMEKRLDRNLRVVALHESIRPFQDAGLRIRKVVLGLAHGLFRFSSLWSPNGLFASEINGYYARCSKRALSYLYAGSGRKSKGPSARFPVR